MKILLPFLLLICSFAAAQNPDIDVLLKEEINKNRSNDSLIREYVLQGASHHIRHRLGKSLLHIACSMADTQLVRILIDRGLEVNNATNKYNETPLHIITDTSWHSKHGYEEERIAIVNLLIKNGAKVNVREKDGFTPLFFESRNGNIIIISSLLAAGADPLEVFETKTYERITSLDIASHFGHLDAVKLLIPAPPANDSNFYERRSYHTILAKALVYAAAGNHQNVAAYLIEQGALDKWKSKGGNSFFRKEQYYVPDRELQMYSGVLAMGSAARNGNIEMLKFLLEQGVPVNFPEVLHYSVLTPLSEAIQSGKIETVEFLLQNGANLNYNTSGRNINYPLAIAIRSNDLEMTEYLLNKGVEFEKDYSGHFENVIKNENTALLELLIRYLPEMESDILFSASSTAFVQGDYKYGFDILKLARNDSIFYSWRLIYPLNLSIKLNSEENLKFLLTKDAVLSNGFRRMESPLHLAVQVNNINFVKILLENGADINLKNDGHTPLDYATTREMREFLKKHGAKKGRRVSKHQRKSTPRSYPYYTGVDRKLWKELTSYGLARHLINLDSVKSYVAQGADIHITNQTNLLHLAAERLDAELIKTLIDKGADVNKAFIRYTPLTSAVKLNIEGVNADSLEDRRLEILKLLMANGANPNIKPKYGTTALIIAALNGDLKVVKYLLENGAKLNSNNKGILSAAVQGGNIELAEFLLENGVKLRNRRYSPVFYAASSGRTDFLKLFKKHGAKLKVRKYGRTSLQEAVTNGHTETVEYLLKNKVPASAKDNWGKSMLYIAAEKGYKEIVSLLVRYGADINERNRSGETLLHQAVRINRTDVVRILLENGADASATNNDGKTVYGYLENSIYDIPTRQLLLQYGADTAINKPVKLKGFSIGTKHAGLGFGDFGKYTGIQFSVAEMDSITNGVNFTLWKRDRGNPNRRSGIINGINASLVSDVGEINGASLSVLVTDATSVNGINISGIYSSISDFSGVNISGLYIYSDEFTGFSFSGIGQEHGYFSGIGISPINLFYYTSSGLIVGGYNYTRSGKGVLLGAVNHIESHNGIQTGLINSTNNSHGLQIGVINFSGHKGVILGVINISDFRGIKLGLINYGETTHGLQIGLLNIIPNKKRFKALPLINFNFKNE